MLAAAALLALLAAQSAPEESTAEAGATGGLRFVPGARLSFTANDDLLALERPSGAPGILTTRPRRTFFDDHDEVDLAYGNALHLSLLAELPEALYGVHGDVTLVGQITFGAGTASLRDAGSSIKLWRDVALGRLILNVFPFEADRMRLGHSERISWGDRGAFRDQTLVPGARVELVRPELYAHLGVKTSTAPVIAPSGAATRDNVWGLLGGVGWDAPSVLRVELGGAYFSRGTIDRAELLPQFTGDPDVPAWTTVGGSLQTTFFAGAPPERPVDFVLLERDPFLRDSFFEERPQTDRYALSTEVLVLRQPLQNPRRLVRTKSQYGVAADVQGELRRGALQLEALAAFRDLAFILFDVPGSSFSDFPVGTAQAPELSAALTAALELSEGALVLGASAGVLRPATLTTTSTAVVHRSVASSTLLPAGERAELLVEAKVSALWRLSAHLATALEVLWARDPNASTIVARPIGLPRRERRVENELWLGGLLRVRL